MKEGRVFDLFLEQALRCSSPSVSVVEDICWVDVYGGLLVLFLMFSLFSRYMCG